MKTVLFACVHNAGRSQMAAAFFNRLADPGRATAVSAGTAPGPRVHPEVADVMRVSSMTVYRLIRTGELAAVRVGRSYRIWESDVITYLQRGAA